MKEDITHKLHNFLNTHDPFREESEIVYFMVELRKLLERIKEETNKNPFPLIQFYCDWTVHTSKKWNTKPIEDIMNKINEILNDNGRPYPKNDGKDNLAFLSMPELKKQLLKLFEEYDLPIKLCTNDDNWYHFIGLFGQVLADQPIIKPIKEIASFCYLVGNNETRSVEIEFTDNRGGLVIGMTG